MPVSTSQDKYHISSCSGLLSFLRKPKYLCDCHIIIFSSNQKLCHKSHIQENYKSDIWSIHYMVLVCVIHEKEVGSTITACLSLALLFLKNRCFFCILRDCFGMVEWIFSVLRQTNGVCIFSFSKQIPVFCRNVKVTRPVYHSIPYNHIDQWFSDFSASIPLYVI